MVGSRRGLLDTLTLAKEKPVSQDPVLRLCLQTSISETAFRSTISIAVFILFTRVTAEIFSQSCWILSWRACCNSFAPTQKFDCHRDDLPADSIVLKFETRTASFIVAIARNPAH